MSNRVTGPMLCEKDNTALTSMGTASQIGPYIVEISNERDINKIEGGTVILFDGDSTEYRVLHVYNGSNQVKLHKEPSLIGPTSFTFWRMPFAVQQRVDNIESLKSYIAEDGSYHTEEIGQSGCLLSGKNATYQSLTQNVRTLVQWDSSLIWSNPKEEWASTPNFFCPKEPGYYSIWASFSLTATSSVVGDQVIAEVSLDGWADQYITVVHQRPDLDFITTYRRNLDLQCLALIGEGQKLGVYVTSGCLTSRISNSYTMHFAAWRVGDSLVIPVP